MDMFERKRSPDRMFADFGKKAGLQGKVDPAHWQTGDRQSGRECNRLRQRWHRYSPEFSASD